MAPARRKPTHNPETMRLSPIQARRLASLASVEPRELEGLTIAEASERLKWIIDPALFWFRELCGKVVKKDPVTGVEYPVPFATVNVQDTDCDLLGYFPEASPWAWHFPIFCRRETIATVTTDQCGDFCVWVPRFEIEWIRRWRELRLCFPIIFNRPILKDLIPPQLIPLPFPPQPDPGPLASLASLPPGTVEALAGQSAGALARKVAQQQAARTLGAPSQAQADPLGRRAFDGNMPPPLPPEFHRALAGKGHVVASDGASGVEGVRGALALKLGVDPASDALAGFNPGRYWGPFWRCVDIFVPEWQLIFEVPDITFEVTQDIGGVQQVIYDDAFGVNWNVSPTPDITLVASPIARETHVCGTPEVPCGDEPAILFAGLMPLEAPYFDAVNGFALRPNRPAHPDGGSPPAQTDLTRPPAATPFCETVQLYGCANVSVGGVDAAYYRVLQSVDGGATYTPITGLSWNIYTFPGGLPLAISPDADGWYQVIADPQDYHPERLLLDWPTPTLGQFVLKLEVADGAKSSLGFSQPVAIQVDNTAPTPIFQTLSWKFVGDPDSALTSLLGLPCPLIKRGATPRDIEVVFSVNVSANHLRNASIWVSGCGGGVFTPVPDPSAKTYHWHTTPGDNAVLLTSRYRLSATALDGCYGFSCEAVSRAMNPSGADGGNLLPTDWNEDAAYIWVEPSISVAVVSET
jgi:hypothetical protein